MLFSCISVRMRLSRLGVLACLAAFVSSAFAGSITGVFQGTIVQLPEKAPNQAKSTARWLYVQGKNGTIRRANIAKATIEYDDDYPRAKRHKLPADSLTKAAIVRVTAEQDEALGGEWQATNVLLIAPPGAAPKLRVNPSTPMPTLAKR